jgi:hypothetical protein
LERGGGFVVVVVVVAVMVGGFDAAVLLLLTAGILAAVVRAAPLGRADIGIAVEETAAHCCWVRREGGRLAVSRWELFDSRACVTLGVHWIKVAWKLRGLRGTSTRKLQFQRPSVL